MSQCYKFAEKPLGIGDRYSKNRYCANCGAYVPLTMIRCICCKYLTRWRSRNNNRNMRNRA